MIAVIWIEPTRKGHTISLLCRKDIALDTFRLVATLRSCLPARVESVKVIAAARIKPSEQRLRTLDLRFKNVACNSLLLITGRKEALGKGWRICRIEMVTRIRCSGRGQ
jgi:hypothetical protein